MPLIAVGKIQVISAHRGNLEFKFLLIIFQYFLVLKSGNDDDDDHDNDDGEEFQRSDLHSAAKGSPSPIIEL